MKGVHSACFCCEMHLCQVRNWEGSRFCSPCKLARAPTAPSCTAHTGHTGPGPQQRACHLRALRCLEPLTPARLHTHAGAICACRRMPLKSGLLGPTPSCPTGRNLPSILGFFSEERTGTPFSCLPLNFSHKRSEHGCR